MRDIKNIEQVTFPEIEIVDNFTFDALSEAGTFSFNFKWFNNRWNLWVTLPDGTVREAGVYPNVINWTGNTDYGLVFGTNLDTINYNSINLVEIFIITWL